MTPQVVWLPEADAELKAALAWYDDVRPELGERFARAIDATVKAIEQNPLQFQLVHRGLRRAGVRRFPYAIFFETQESRILVIACFHGRRDPKHWKVR